MSTPPDYGEPWTPAFRNSARTFNGYDHGFMADFQKRAITCVNACAGMADPAAEIQAMRDVIKAAHKSLFYVSPVFGRTPAQDAALAKLQPFIKP